jgi:hypothetical protein
MTRWLAVVAAFGVAAVAAGGALAVGPWPGLAASVRSPSGELRYAASRDAATNTTTVRAIAPTGRVEASTAVPGAFGIPAVTSGGAAGGLSPDGRLLVLVEPPQYTGLRMQSRFALLGTAPLRRLTTISLAGELGFDAVSPDRRTLYLIEHVSRRDLVRYVVRAYDLRTRRLLPAAIVDRRDPGEAMRGYPVARATSPGGGWVYTLYTRNADSAGTFVHALDASRRTAFCIDLPGWSGGEDVWNARLRLAGGTLLVRSGTTTVTRIDTTTLRTMPPG